MMETKICVQCGEALPLDAFRPYKSRSTGKRKTTVTPGRSTICKRCESFNAVVTMAYNVEPSERTAKQQYLVAAATEVYKAQIARGLTPAGRLARSLPGNKPSASMRVKKEIAEYIRNNLPQNEEVK